MGAARVDDALTDGVDDSVGECDEDDDVVIGSDLGIIGGINGEDSGYQVNIPETCRRRALCHME